MKLFGILLVAILFAFLGTQLYSSLGYQKKLAAELGVLEKKLEEVNADGAALRADIDYYGNPENLEKELRARFNYHKAGEVFLILIPSSETPASGTQP